MNLRDAYDNNPATYFIRTNKYLKPLILFNPLKLLDILEDKRIEKEEAVINNIGTEVRAYLAENLEPLEIFKNVPEGNKDNKKEFVESIEKEMGHCLEEVTEKSTEFLEKKKIPEKVKQAILYGIISELTLEWNVYKRLILDSD